MSDRIVAAVREEPRRGLGLPVVLAAIIAAVLVMVSGSSAASGAAAKKTRTHRSRCGRGTTRIRARR
jgi:hypothetical protein